MNGENSYVKLICFQCLEQKIFLLFDLFNVLLCQFHITVYVIIEDFISLYGKNYINKICRFSVK